MTGKKGVDVDVNPSSNPKLTDGQHFQTSSTTVVVIVCFYILDKIAKEYVYEGVIWSKNIFIHPEFTRLFLLGFPGNLVSKIFSQYIFIYCTYGIYTARFTFIFPFFCLIHFTSVFPPHVC